MNDEQDKQSAEAESGIDREIRQARKFTPEEALARMAGPGAMKGASPVSPVQQAETEIGTWLRVHVADPAGVLQMLLQRNLKGSELLLENLEHPLTALTRYCRKVLGSGYLLEELVRQADMEWGQRMDERPHFDRAGSSPNPDDPYTLVSVREALNNIVAQLVTSS